MPYALTMLTLLSFEITITQARRDARAPLTRLTDQRGIMLLVRATSNVNQREGTRFWPKSQPFHAIQIDSGVKRLSGSAFVTTNAANAGPNIANE